MYLWFVHHTACSNGEIRLEGGRSLYEGRVEICRNQRWGSVCDNSWTNVDATVVCRHLGYSGFSNDHSDSFIAQKQPFLFLLQMPKPFPMPSMVVAVDHSTWTMFSALDLNLISLIVLVIHHHLVLMLTMLEFAAIPHV